MNNMKKLFKKNSNFNKKPKNFNRLDYNSCSASNNADGHYSNFSS